MTPPPSSATKAVRTAAASGAILSIGAALVGPVSPAQADTFAVDSAADDGSGGTTLREAIEAANLNPGPDTVTIPAGLGPIVLTGGQIEIDDELTIVGAGAASVTISGNSNDRIFYINSDAVSVTISGVTLTGGDSSDGGAIRSNADLTLQASTLTGNVSSSDGGALYVGDGDLTISDTTFSENSAYGNGGGLAVDYATSVTITDSTFTGNSTTWYGGGLHIDDVAGSVTLTGLTVTDNVGNEGGGIDIHPDGDMDVSLADSTISGNEAARGGGVHIQHLYGSFDITNTTISDNTASETGGGIRLSSFTDTDLTITASTISGNSAGDAGGGIHVSDYNSITEPLDGTVTIDRTTISGNDADLGGGLDIGATNIVVTSSTISGNEAATDGGGARLSSTGSTSIAHSTIAGNTSGGQGGGAFIYDVGDIEIDHTIVAGNTADDGDELYGMGGPIAIANSLIQGEISSVTQEDGGGNLTGVDPQLGTLADNGGPTPTHALLAGSPAIDAGDPTIAGAPATDQRGLARIQGEGIDIGAFEVQDPTDEPTPTTEPATPTTPTTPGGPAPAQPVVANPRFVG